MIKTRIIPVLLLRGNSVVKSVRFAEHRMVGDAISQVKVFSTRFADEMMIVDIGATAKNVINDALIRRLAASCTMPLSIGGGVHSVACAERLFRSGADKVVINSAYYQKPQLLAEIAERYGRQSIVFSLDVRRNGEHFQPYSHGGRVQQPGDARELIVEAVRQGAGEIVVNSIDQDGLMQGYDFDLIQSCASLVSVPVIAAGGCGSADDCVRACRAGAHAVAAGSIFYWIGESILTLKQHMGAAGLNMRML